MSRRLFIVSGAAALALLLAQVRTSSAQFIWGLPIGAMSPFQGWMWYWPGGVPATMNRGLYPYGLTTTYGGYGMGYGGQGMGGQGGYGMGPGGYGAALGYGPHASAGSGLAADPRPSEVGYWPPSPKHPFGQPVALPSDLVYQGSDLPARIHLTVPAGAQVLVDGQPTSQTGSSRVFSTPPLTQGQPFHYDLVARWDHDGKPMEVKKRVRVYSGADVRVTMQE